MRKISPLLSVALGLATAALMQVQPRAASLTTLMQPGLWSINATQTLQGQTVNSSGSQCFTPEKVAQITSGNGQLLLNNPTGSGCQLQQQLVGNQITAGGQCSTGNTVIQMSARITFETPEHFVGQASWVGTAGPQQLNITSFFEGRLVGGC